VFLRPDAAQRREAAVALGLERDERAVKPLIKALGDPDETVRQAASEALARIGEPAVRPLINALRSLPDVVLEWGEVWRRPRTITSGWRWRLRERRAVEAMVAALVRIGRPALSAIMEAFQKENVDLHKNLAVVLAEIGEPSVEPLLASLQHKHWSVREWSAKALGWIGDERAVDPLCERCGDENLHVCEGAIAALGLVGGKRAVARLKEVLRSENPRIRNRAILALGVTRDEQAVEPLVQLLRDPRNAGFHHLVIRALKKLDTPLAHQAIAAYRTPDKT
jgi:HEAT repeat protein